MTRNILPYKDAILLRRRKVKKPTNFKMRGPNPDKHLKRGGKISCLHAKQCLTKNYISLFNMSYLSFIIG